MPERRVRLAEAIRVAEGLVDPTIDPYRSMPHIGGENIESATGRLIGITSAEALGLKSGKYPFWPGDVLYSKIRPALNKVAAVTFEGICSADIYPLRCHEDVVAPEYLVYLLRSRGFLAYADKHSTRTNIPKVNREALLGYEVDLPPLPEQRRIAALLDKADAIRRKHQQAIRLADDLLRSAFLEVFGDVTRGAHRWARVPLGRLCVAIVDCPHSTPAYAPSQTAYPCIRTSDLQDGFLDFSTTKYVDAGEYQDRIVREAPAPGDVLYSREGERFGIAAMVPPGTTPCLGQRMMLLRTDEAVARPAFLWALLNSPAFYSRVAQLAGGSTSPHVNVADIKQLPAFLPPLPLQIELERLVGRIVAIRNDIISAIPTTDRLLHSLVQRAFGEGLSQSKGAA